MPVSGLVVSFGDRTADRAATLKAIRAEPRVTVGPETGTRLAVVLDTTSEEDDRQLWDWLYSLPGVTLIEVAFIGLDQGEDAASVAPPSAAY